MNFDKARRLIFEKLVECAQHTDWGTTFEGPDALARISREYPYVGDVVVRESCLRPPQLSCACDVLSHIRPTDPRRTLYVFPENRPETLPRFFSWIAPFTFCASSSPRGERDIHLLRHVGVRTVVTLTEESPLPPAWFNGTMSDGVRHVDIFIRNGYVPTFEQMDAFMEMLFSSDEKQGGVCVHCGGGKGRTGVFVACYIALFGVGGHTRHAKRSADGNRG